MTIHDTRQISGRIGSGIGNPALRHGEHRTAADPAGPSGPSFRQGVRRRRAAGAEIRRVSVIGCGLIGTSVALALRRTGVRVALSDHDPHSLLEAVRAGAGVALSPRTPPADVVVIATPPSTVAGMLREAQSRGLGTVYTDVASTKARILADAELAGCDLTSYVPGHPMAGRELSGPGAALADLFTGRPWALCPHPAASPRAVRTVTDLVTACGAEPVLLAPDAHDRTAAAVSHAPHVVSAALAARFADAGRSALSLAGRGLWDVTRVAGSPPGLWRDILAQNAEPVAEMLEAVARDLADVASALRAPSAGSGIVADLLDRGNRGRALITGEYPADTAGREGASRERAA
ncbi:prephenate dehydrogenase [Planomonospora sp. ID67723]|uniref:prephenate dehydrogenase n=1 Tax=Planomonospora sp. ID67723 TaxID=2738134 RepID=UPI0018C36A7E|nr:prephenate dehydrogenase [Planomonospora sp. ID67723]MBG0829130.1 prephenate dehydrogenase [Planomonospora sp. ID67723]